MSEFVMVDPGDLYLPPSRAQGADPAKLEAIIGMS
jgi:hypothetical protein